MTEADAPAEDVVPTSPNPRPTRPGHRRRLSLLVAAVVGVPLVLVALAASIVVTMALLGLSIDASRWRDAAEQRASAALGLPVVIEGEFGLAPTLGREIAVRIGTLRILNAPGFAGRHLLAIDGLQVRLDLFEALRGGLRSSRIEARGVALHLERGADGKGNWTVLTARDASSPQAAVDIARIALRRLELHYDDARSAKRRSVALEDLAGSIGHDRPLRLAARGRLEPGHDFAFAIDGGPLRLLRDDAEHWPIAVEVSAPGTRLHAKGALDARHGTARAQLEARAEDLASIGRLVGSSLPDVGTSSLSGAITVASSSVHLSELIVRLGESELAGQLSVAFDGARPRVSGTLRAPVLDLRPLLAATSRPASPQPGTEARAEPALPLRALSAVDAEVDLKIEHVLGLSVDIRDASLDWRANERGVRVPLSATVAGAALAGSLDLDTSVPTPALALHLGADNAALGELVQGFGLAGGIDGRVRRIRLHASGRGESTATLVHDLEFSLAVAGARLRFAGDDGTRPIDVSIDTLELAARRGARLQGHARGALQGERASLRFRGGTVSDMLRDHVLPLELDLALAQARLRIEGTLAPAAPTRDATVRFDFQARRAGDLSRWLSVSPQADLPVAVRGTARLSKSAPTLAATLTVGRSQATIDARTLDVAGRPRIVASVRSELIDAGELTQLAAGRDTNRGGRPRSTAGASPASTDLPDVDIDVQVQRLLVGRTDVQDLAFVARTRSGRLLPSSLAGKIGGAPFTADVDADLQGAQPAGSLRLTTGAIELGALLRGLGIAEDLDGKVQALQLDLQGRGNGLAELARHSSFELRVTGGRLAVRGAARSTIADITVHEAHIGALAGEPVRARVKGAIDQSPVTIDISSGTLSDFASNAGHLPFALEAQAAQTRLALSGEVSLPLGSGGKLNLEMRGERLDSLSTLARVELPAWGPWSFSSPIKMTTAGYELPSLHAKVGSSELRGAAALDLGGPRPHLSLQAAAPTIQLDDFPLPQRLTDGPEVAAEDRGLRRTASRLAGRTDRLLSAAFLRRGDATIGVKAGEVLSGGDRLLDGSLRLTLANGHLSLDPAVINLPGGAIRLSISYALKEPDVELAVAARVERFDYGVIARRLDRAQNLRGLISLDLDLVGSAPSLETIMHSANGRADFAIWPDELSGGVFNFWSVNLLLKVVPLIDPDTRPKVNCIIGRFDLEDGILNDEKILIDTSAVRIRGAGRANLATEKLEFVFRPRAKGLALFRLQNPLHVTGSLGEPRFGFQRRDTLEAVFRQVASPILLPIERLTLGPLPRDGADVCADPLRTVAATPRSAAE